MFLFIGMAGMYALNYVTYVMISATYYFSFSLLMMYPLLFFFIFSVCGGCLFLS